MLHKVLKVIQVPQVLKESPEPKEIQVPREQEPKVPQVLKEIQEPKVH